MKSSTRKIKASNVCIFVNVRININEWAENPCQWQFWWKAGTTRTIPSKVLICPECTFESAVCASFCYRPCQLGLKEDVSQYVPTVAVIANTRFHTKLHVKTEASALKPDHQVFYGNANSIFPESLLALSRWPKSQKTVSTRLAKFANEIHHLTRFFEKVDS